MSSATITQGELYAKQPHRVEVAADDLTAAHWPKATDSALSG